MYRLKFVNGHLRPRIAIGATLPLKITVRSDIGRRRRCTSAHKAAQPSQCHYCASQRQSRHPRFRMHKACPLPNGGPAYSYLTPTTAAARSSQANPIINDYKRRSKTVDRVETPPSQALISRASVSHSRESARRHWSALRLRGSGYAGFRSEILIHHSPIHLHHATTFTCDLYIALHSSYDYLLLGSDSEGRTSTFVTARRRDPGRRALAGLKPPRTGHQISTMKWFRKRESDIEMSGMMDAESQQKKKVDGPPEDTEYQKFDWKRFFLAPKYIRKASVPASFGLSFSDLNPSLAHTVHHHWYSDSDYHDKTRRCGSGKSAIFAC
jgi:hypothetical protein